MLDGTQYLQLEKETLFIDVLRVWENTGLLQPQILLFKLNIVITFDFFLKKLWRLTKLCSRYHTESHVLAQKQGLFISAASFHLNQVMCKTVKTVQHQLRPVQSFNAR